MSTDTTYNGWTNRATWVVNLHLEELFYSLTLDHLRQEVASLGAEEVADQRHTSDIADLLRSSLEEILEELRLPGLVTDLMIEEQIDWYDIAEHHISTAYDELGIDINTTRDQTGGES